MHLHFLDTQDRSRGSNVARNHERYDAAGAVM
jgi:hypothetical protein